MKADDLFRALGDVDPQYVEGLLAEKKNEIRRDSATAEEKTVIPLKPVRRKKIWLSAAVAIVAVVSGVSLLSVMLLRGFSVPNATILFFGKCGRRGCAGVVYSRAADGADGDLYGI